MSGAGGNRACAFLAELAEGRTVVCEPPRERTRGRRVGICRLDGRDLAELEIAAGLALDGPRHSQGRYAMAETSAAAALPFPGYRLTR